MVDLLSDASFLGLLGIGLSVFFGLLAIALSIRSERGSIDRVRTTLEDSENTLRLMSQSGIDEKIAQLNYYALIAFNWKTGIPKRVEVRIERITLDIRAVVRAKSAMTDEQKERFKFAVRNLIKEMQKQGFDTGRIEDVASLV